MSIASILTSKNEDIYFAEINAGTINCDVLNAKSGGGGGGGSGINNITSTDNSLTVTATGGTANIEFSSDLIKDINCLNFPVLPRSTLSTFEKLTCKPGSKYLSKAS